MAPNADNGTRRDCGITTNNYLAMNKYKPLSLAAILALMFTLSACSEQLLETVTEDPEPETTSGEADYTTSQVLAQNSADDERSPQPNDITLGSYNSSIDDDPSNDINGTSRLMPIRIPFSGRILDLYDSDGAIQPAARSAYQANIIIYNTANNSFILPFPLEDRAGEDGGGTFKDIYQEDNTNDLVFVPDTNTFSNGTTYVFIVYKALGDNNGEILLSDTLTQLVTTTNELINESNTTIYSALLKDRNGNGIDEDAEDLKAAAGLEVSRKNFVQILTAFGKTSDDVAVMFSFKTDPDITDVNDDSTGAVNNGVSDSFEQAVALARYISVADTVTLSALEVTTSTLTDLADENINWLADDLASISANIDTNSNLKDAILASGYLEDDLNLSEVSGLYKGFFRCTNFLTKSGTKDEDGNDVWLLDDFSKMTTTVLETQSYYDCPNSLSYIDENELNGTIGFWLSVPDSPQGLALYLHGIGNSKDQFFSVANRMAVLGMSTIAIDIWGHGERTYEDGDKNGVVDNNMSSNYGDTPDDDEDGDSGALFVRPDNPALTVGYYLQTLFDIYRLSNLVIDNSELLVATGVASLADDNDEATPYKTNLHYLGLSLGGFIGSTAALQSDSTGGAIFPFYRYAFSASGGDLTDTVLNGSLGVKVRKSVAESNTTEYDTSTVKGTQALNSAMVAIDLLTSQAVFSTAIDPLAVASEVLPERVLLQEVVGDTTVINASTELLAKSLQLENYSDGGDSIDTESETVDTKRVRWTLNPDNYSILKGENKARHTFLVDGNTTATEQSQWQAACFLRYGYIPDTNKTITISDSSCSAE